MRFLSSGFTASVLGLAALGFLGSTVAPAASAQTTTITFDAGDPIGGLAEGATLSNQYAASGVTFTANAFSGPGGPTGTWSANTDMTVVSSTGGDVGGLGTPSLVSGNLLRSFDGWLAERGDPSFRANFSTSIFFLSADFAGIATPGSTHLYAYNGTTLLTSATATTLTGQQTLTVSSATPITSVVFTPGDFFDWVGVDNITFTSTASVNPVPEPSEWLAMGMAGASVGGLMVRARRRRSGRNEKGSITLAA